MIKKMVLVASLLAATALATPAVAQEDNSSLPGSVFVLPQQGEGYMEPEEDPEITNDIEIFARRGFVQPDWDTHTAQVADVLRDVVLPDWKKRTGEKNDPEHPSIDIATAMITGGDYNDLLVMSRLPRDCTAKGCLFQLYSLFNEVWVKRFEFHTVAFAWKIQDDTESVSIARVGGMDVPSKTFEWKDGKLN